jgi:hypothetical protein
LELESQDFTPILALLDEAGNLLGTTAGQPDASVDDLEAPTDLTLMLDVMAEDEAGSGDFVLRIIPAGG